MKPKTVVATVLVSCVASFVAASAIADPGTSVQADLARLTTDITTGQGTLNADLQAITSDAQAENRTAGKRDLVTFRSDLATVVPAIKADRTQLRNDLEADRAAHLTDLAPLVRTALQADRAALREIAQVAHQARAAAHALRHGRTS